MKKYRPQWGRNEGYSPTDRLDKAVESVQSDAEWDQRIRIPRIWAWQNPNAAVAWKTPDAQFGDNWLDKLLFLLWM
jgi:hypothetical protein